MGINITCPACSSVYPVEAGLVDGDAKRLSAMLAGMDSTLARAALGYLRLFKPAKSALRLTKAATLLAELDDLVAIGTVSADERSGLRRQASIAVWVAGMEQMTHNRADISVPLGNHNYLRKVVYGLADQVDAKAEARLDDQRRVGQHRYPSRAGTGISPPQPREDPLQNTLKWLEQQYEYGQISEEERDLRRQEAREKHGNRSDA